MLASAFRGLEFLLFVKPLGSLEHGNIWRNCCKNVVEVALNEWRFSWVFLFITQTEEEGTRSYSLTFLESALYTSLWRWMHQLYVCLITLHTNFQEKWTAPSCLKEIDFIYTSQVSHTSTCLMPACLPMARSLWTVSEKGIMGWSWDKWCVTFGFGFKIFTTIVVL